MSTFGGSSGGMTPGNFGPGSGYAPDGVSSQPFGDFYQMLQNQANTPNQLPDGYAYNPATGKAQEQGVGFYGTTNSMHFDPMGTQGITGTQQVMGAAMGDFNNLNAANDFNYGNRVDANNQFLTFQPAICLNIPSRDYGRGSRHPRRRTDCTRSDV